MAQTIILPQLRANGEKILLCAKLSQFAYASAIPSKKISVDDNEACEQLYHLLIQLGQQARGIGDHHHGHFARFASKTWWRSHKSQFRWFRSQSYFYHYFDQKDDVNRIIVAFRGTWNDGNESKYWHHEPDPNATLWARWGPPAWYNWLSREFPPSNIGLSDFYYDATIIRIPYTDGTVWKWWAYWASLVLERTRLGCLTWIFYPARISAADWISRPNHDRIATSNPVSNPDPAATSRPADTLDHGDVHLGFWSLWASPEGFAGYDRFGNLPENEPRVLLKVQDALNTGREGKGTEILVVGHSLGGAVSCFAALDLVRKLEDWEKEDVKIFHATFGAPAVGDPDFQTHFNRHFNQQHLTRPGSLSRQESWSIYHQRDLVASCFAFCGTLPFFKHLGWWGDWRGVGHRIRLTHLIAPQPDDRGWLRRTWDSISHYGRWVLGVPAAILYYPRYLLKQRPRPITRPKPGWGGGRTRQDPRPSASLSTEYHSLHQYIQVMEKEDCFAKAEIMEWDPGQGEVPTGTGTVG